MDIVAHESRISLRTAVVKPIASIVAICTGAPFGAEGPIILTGGALGSLLGQAVRVSPAERRTLVAAGAAAGMAAIFGAPIGAVLAIEPLLFEFSPRVFVPIVVASVFADAVHIMLLGHGPLFAVPAQDFAGLAPLPFYLVLGVACGLIATTVTWGVFAAEDAFERLPIKRFWHPILGAAAIALLGLAIPADPRRWLQRDQRQSRRVTVRWPVGGRGRRQTGRLVPGYRLRYLGEFARTCGRAFERPTGTRSQSLTRVESWGSAPKETSSAGPPQDQPA